MIRAFLSFFWLKYPKTFLACFFLFLVSLVFVWAALVVLIFVKLFN